MNSWKATISTILPVKGPRKEGIRPPVIRVGYSIPAHPEASGGGSTMVRVL